MFHFLFNYGKGKYFTLTFAKEFVYHDERHCFQEQTINQPLDEWKVKKNKKEFQRDEDITENVKFFNKESKTVGNNSLLLLYIVPQQYNRKQKNC